MAPSRSVEVDIKKLVGVAKREACRQEKSRLWAMSKFWNTLNGSPGLAPVNQVWGHNLRLINVVNEMRN